MRLTPLVVCLLAVIAATTASTSRDANAAVCAVGTYRAGCVGPNGAVVVKRPPVACQYRYVWVNGVRVRRCR